MLERRPVNRHIHLNSHLHCIRQIQSRSLLERLRPENERVTLSRFLSCQLYFSVNRLKCLQIQSL